MKEKRLYELAHEALLMKWGKEHDFLEKYPNNEASKIREKQLWDELIEMEDEMKNM